MNTGELKQRQQLPRKYKDAHAIDVLQKFYDYFDGDIIVNVAGIDSLTVWYFCRRYIDPNIKGLTVLAAEPKANRNILIKEPNLTVVAPAKTKQQVLKEEGYPVGSKDIAKAVRTFQAPSPKNYISRRAYLTGVKENGEYSQWMKLAKRWFEFIDKNSLIDFIIELLEHFSTVEPESLKGITKEKVIEELSNTQSYVEALNSNGDIKISEKCCYYTKEYVLNKYCKENGFAPIMGLSADEGGHRETAILQKGCTIFDGDNARCLPFAYHTRSDRLALALELGVPISSEYGEIVQIGTDQYGEPIYDTTLAKRTGCEMCGFGLQMEARPHRFDRMQKYEPQSYELWVNQRGWGEIMKRLKIPFGDYIWEDEFDEKIIRLFQQGVTKEKLIQKLYKQRKRAEPEKKEKYYQSIVESIILNYYLSNMTVTG